MEIAFNGILQIYINCSCDISLIEGYINGNKEAVKSILNNLGENRKAEQMQAVNKFFSGLQTQIEEGQIKESKSRNMGDISKIKFQNKEITNRIFAQIESSFQNIRVAQRKFLSARAYSEERIQSIDVNVQAFIKSLRRNDEIIKRAFELDEKECQQLVTEKYKEYMQYEENEEKILAEIGNKQSENESSSRNEKEEFKKSLDAGIPLEEQRENAQRFVKEQEDNNEKGKVMSLPDNVIE